MHQMHAARHMGTKLLAMASLVLAWYPGAASVTGSVRKVRGVRGQNNNAVQKRRPMRLISYGDRFLKPFHAQE